MSAAGFLAPGSGEDSVFCAKTHAAVLAFQDSYGLRTTGEVDDLTWSTLIEASWSLGERLLFLRSPNIRGDDVAELQVLLNRLGFDCGRVDGIFGPLLVKALSDFQENIGVEPNGICTPELVAHVQRMALQTGEGKGIAAVREDIELTDASSTDNTRIVIGYFAGATQLAHSISRRTRELHPLTSTVDTDALSQAQAANRFMADVYVGCEINQENSCIIYYYEVPDFVSAGGRNLAQRISDVITQRVPEVSVHTQGVRHPVLRETRMTAVLCSMGPADIVGMKTSALSSAISDALELWRKDPSGA